ncbi:MAG: hypothetical protein IJ074_09200, partial [Clostridia bacterium]|nr:hypothetical protein [Clostridia bacterium]
MQENNFFMGIAPYFKESFSIIANLPRKERVLSGFNADFPKESYCSAYGYTVSGRGTRSRPRRGARIF